MSTLLPLWFNVGGQWTRRGRNVTPPPTAPVVASFSPTSGVAGTQAVTVTGSGFTGATVVRFGASNATFTVLSDAQITTTVPAGAATGPVTVVTPAGSGTSSASFTVTPAPPAPTGTVARFLEPLKNGGAYWGFYPSGNSISTLKDFEAGSNRTYDILKTYVTPDLNWLSSASIQAAVFTDGRIPHFSFAWRATGKNGATIHPLLPAPQSSNASLGQPYNECYLYSQMYSGVADAWIDEFARLWIAQGWNSLPVVLFDFNHEPEATRASATATPSESAKIRMGCFSDPDWYFSTGGGSVYTDHKWDVLQEFVKASEYLVARLRARGVTNLLNIITHASFTRPDWQHQALYSAKADAFGWDPYSGSDVPSKWSAGYNRLEGGIFLKYDAAVTRNGLAGTTLDAGAKSKPYFVQEWGILTRPADSTYAQYINTVITALKQFPKIKAATMYSSGSTSIIDYPLSKAAFQSMSRDPYVNKTHPS